MTIKDLFELQVRKTPQAIAINYQGSYLTYEELNVKSNRLAHFIRCQYHLKIGRPLTPDTLLGLCVMPSLEMVIGLLAILKSNAAYIPIDPEYPRKRIDAIATDAGIEWIITQKELTSYFTNELNFIFVEDESDYSNLDESNLESILTVDNLVYVIYTSGSTGSPKGVMITHKSVCNYIYWMSTFGVFKEPHIFDCSLSISFDAVIQVLFFPLCTGLAVNICPSFVKKDPSSYLSYLQSEYLTVTKITPSYLVTLIDYMQRNGTKKNNLKILIVGGEKFLLGDAIRWNQLYPNCLILHHYGPTEATVGSLCHWVNFANNYRGVLPLGQPGYNMACYVITDYGQLAKSDEIGELCISGYGLSKGYFNLPELTKKRFIKNTFSTEPGFERLYKTGDLVKYRSSGDLEFIGRVDDQIKLRGYRVECGEIEFILKEYAGIQQCVVIVRVVNQLECLVAYYTCCHNIIIEVSKLRAYLKEVLPYYMIPSHFVVMNRFLLTVNGKIDKNILPLPEQKNRFLL